MICTLNPVGLWIEYFCAKRHPLWHLGKNHNTFIIYSPNECNSREKPCKSRSTKNRKLHWAKSNFTGCPNKCLCDRKLSKCLRRPRGRRLFWSLSISLWINSSLTGGSGTHHFNPAVSASWELQLCGNCIRNKNPYLIICRAQLWEWPAGVLLSAKQADVHKHSAFNLPPLLSSPVLLGLRQKKGSEGDELHSHRPWALLSTLKTHLFSRSLLCLPRCASSVPGPIMPQYRSGEEAPH